MTLETFTGAIDLGGTKILSLCLNQDLAIVGRDYRETLADGGVSTVVQRMADSLRQACKGRVLTAVGVAAPGLCDIERGIVTEAPNLPGWHNVPLGQMLADSFGVPVWVENDANAAALAEQRLGAGRGSRHLIFIAAGTGMGGGFVVNGRIYRGASGAAGEIGHMRLVDDGPLCGCGNHGCLEALTAGRHLAVRAREIIQREPHGILARVTAEAAGDADARLLQAAADAGDTGAAEVILRAGHYLGVGLGNLINIFNPDVIAIGGSLRKLGEPYVGTATRVAQAMAFPQNWRDVRIVEAELEDEAPAIGAVLIARDGLTAT